MRKQRAIQLIEQTMADRANMDVSTVELLYRCQEIASLLELGNEDTLWIELELSGYRPQDGASTVPKGHGVPLYRILQFPVEIRDPRTDLYDRRSKPIEIMATFSVTYSCGQLESATDSLPLGYTQLLTVPELGIMGAAGRKEKVPLSFMASLSIHAMQGIIRAVRGRINKFVSSHYTALRFEEPLYDIFNSTRGMMADRLSRLHNPLLSLIEETIREQERSTDSVEWQDVLENTRNIVRTITEHVLQDTMLLDGEERPDLNETSKKTKIILRWIQNNIDESIGNQSEYIEKMLESLSLGQSALIDLINKLSHPPASKTVEKWDVDRLVLNTILWISELIALLDKAGFSWDNQ